MVGRQFCLVMPKMPTEARAWEIRAKTLSYRSYIAYDNQNRYVLSQLGKGQTIARLKDTLSEKSKGNNINNISKFLNLFFSFVYK